MCTHILDGQCRGCTSSSGDDEQKTKPFLGLGLDTVGMSDYPTPAVLVLSAPQIQWRYPSPPYRGWGIPRILLNYD